MTGHDFLTVARTLAGSGTEAEWRTAASRAYFAAFHIVRDLFRDLGFAVPRSEAAHKYLAFRLQNCGRVELQKVGSDLDDLRDLRNRADYDLSPMFVQQRANASITVAQQIIRDLALATVEPTRTQVRDAMIDYERNVLRQLTWSPPPP